MKIFIHVNKLDTVKPSGKKIKNPYGLVNLPPFSQPQRVDFNSKLEAKDDKIFTFELSDIISMTSIEFILRSEVLLKEDETFGKALISLKWLPKDKVVKEWFPIEPYERGIVAPKVLLDIHVATNEVSAFSAPSGKLLIEPIWNPFDDSMATVPKVLPL